MDNIANKIDLSKPNFSRYFAVVTVILIGALLIIFDLQPYFAYLEKKARIRAIIPIGSNIDDAGPILKKNGFHFYEKSFATVAEDYYCIDVTVASEPRPWTLTILGLVGIRAYYHWVVIEAGLDNQVRKIY